jgi:CheY-like chemotaxis protein
MGDRKEPLEITCSSCNTRFRMWIPVEMLPEWEGGSYINCIKCGTRYSATKNASGFHVVPAPGSAVRGGGRGSEQTATAALTEAAPPAQADAAGEQAAPGETVLLIEDDRLIREMAEGAVKDMGIRLLTVKNAADALSVLDREKVAGIVTDLYLKNPDDPESLMDGEDLLREIADKGFNLPAIIITGKDIIDDIVLDPKWFDLHVKGFIQKGNPFWTDELKLKLKEVIHTD